VWDFGFAIVSRAFGFVALAVTCVFITVRISSDLRSDLGRQRAFGFRFGFQHRPDLRLGNRAHPQTAPFSDLSDFLDLRFL
jgi:hypothetical protein